METPMMKCGHAANATCDGKPSCAICLWKPEGKQVADPPDLKGRKAKCFHYPNGGKYGRCQDPVDSSPNLAFFKHDPVGDTDEYYCGCWGWD